MEALAQLSPAIPVRSLQHSRAATALSEARSCYDHLAGRRGVELRDRLLTTGTLVMIKERDHELTSIGEAFMADLGINVDEVRAAGRMLARTCVDWTHRRLIWPELCQPR